MFFVALGIVMVKPDPGEGYRCSGRPSSAWPAAPSLSRVLVPFLRNRRAILAPLLRAAETGRPWSRRPSSAPTSRSCCGWAA
ncbi:MAG: hypothetical protein M0C28_45210 [Candidatus Moduliflexus flocculans]|nr:hypothetical protein [Candidatus Moduliflexus flocculans]